MHTTIHHFKYIAQGCLCVCTAAAILSLSALSPRAESVGDTGTATASDATPAQETSAQSPTLWVIGDSTVAEFQDNYYYPRYGWGTQLYRYFEGLRIRNLAVSGTSTKSFLETPQYQELMAGMQPGDFLLIGFGHNDEKAESARFTDAGGSVTTPGSTQYYLAESYFKPAKEAGVSPIVCTPIVRRDLGNNYTGASGHIIGDQSTIEGTFPGGDYGNAVMRAGVAKNVPVLNLTKRTREIYEQLGAQGVKNRHAQVSHREISLDNTHTNLYGAACNAWLVADELAKTNSPLKAYLVENPTPPDPSILTVNPNYVAQDYTAPAGESTRWPSVGDWKGTVFGDIGALEYLNDIYFTLAPYEEGSVRVAAGRFAGGDEATVGATVGKIGTTTDGIAMYYQPVAADKTFTFSADVTILQLDPNNQASFGLMVRDDMYLDTVTNDTLGDYVAAGALMMGSKEPWNCFARKSGVLTQGGPLTRMYGPGETVHVKIRKSSDGYTCTYGENAPVSAGFDFPLTGVDPEHVYTGLFVARSADVVFSNVSLVVD